MVGALMVGIFDTLSRVLIPLLIDRNSTFAGNPRIKMTNQSHREYIYRMAYQAGRHILGYEVQKVLAAAGIALLRS